MLSTTFLIVYPAMAVSFGTAVAAAHVRAVKRRAGVVERLEWIGACTWGFILGMVWPLSLPLLLTLVITMLINKRGDE